MVKTIILVLFLSLLAAACGSCGMPPQKYLHHDVYESFMKEAPRKYADPEIVGYINDFMALCDKHGLHGRGLIDEVRTIEFSSSIEQLEDFGLCRIFSIDMYFAKQEVRTITISPAAKDAGPYTLRATIYHESTHCIWDVEGHSPDQFDIMAPISLPEQYYADHWGTMEFNLVEQIKNKDIDLTAP